MNILFANYQEFDPQIGGVEKVSAVIAEEMTKAGHNVFYSAQKKSKYSKKYTLFGEQLITGDSDELAGFIKEKHIEIVLNQAGNDLEYTQICAEAAKRSGIMMYSEIHIDPFYKLSGIKDCHLDALDENLYQMFKNVLKTLLLPIRLEREKKRIKAFYRQIFDMSDKVILLSDSFIPPLKKILDQGQTEKICVIPNPSPYELQKSLEKEKIILYVGRINEAQKRTDRLIRIWEKIYREYPDWELHILGDGDAKEKLQNYVDRKRIKNVQFMGFCDPIEEYKRAEIICMTSSFEGFGMVLLEAQTFGCIPIVYNTFSSLSDVVKDGVNGCVINEIKWKPYVKKLKELMGNNELRDCLRKGMPGVVKDFDKDIIAKKWLALFESSL